MFEFGPLTAASAGIIVMEEGLNGVAHRSQNNTTNNERVEPDVPVEANDRMRSFLLGLTNWGLGVLAGGLSLYSYNKGNIPLAIDAGQAMMTFVLPGTIRIFHGLVWPPVEQPRDLTGVKQLANAYSRGKFFEALTGTYK